MHQYGSFTKNAAKSRSTLNSMNAVIRTLADLLRLILQVIVIYVERLCHVLIGTPKKQVKNKVVVITGAGHGLGRELALQLSSLEAKLVLLDINEVNNKNVEKEIRANGGKVISYTCDVTSRESVNTCIENAIQYFGTIDVLINNAGITYCLPIDRLTESQIRTTFDVNVMGHFWLIKAVLPTMQQNNSGHIVAISSIAGLLGTAYLTDYCASKHATVGLMKALDAELHQENANKNIHLTTICPLAMSTGMFLHPKSRFSHLFPIIGPEYVAEKVIDAMLKNKLLVTVPGFVEAIYRCGHIVPAEAFKAFDSFLNYGVDPHN